VAQTITYLHIYFVYVLRNNYRIILYRLHEIDAEAVLMEALAEVEEDEWPDDGAVEVDSDEEYNRANK